MKVVGYVRVSGRTQVDDGFGLDLQRTAIETWCAANGHEIVTWATDGGVSGVTEAIDRPGFAEAIRALEDGEAEGFVAYDMTRLARTLMVQEAALTVLWRTGGAVFTTATGPVLDDDGDPMRTLIRQILGAIAQFDKNTSVLRMRRGKEAAAARGRKVDGRYAYGEHPDHPEEADTVLFIRKLRDEGLSHQEIANELDRRSVPTRLNRTWGRSTIRNILQRDERHIDTITGS